MNRVLKASAIIMCFTLLGFSQTIDNVQFTDMNGKSYDLYQVLESGKHVLCHFTFNG